MNLAQDGTPEGKQAALLRGLQEQIRAQQEWQKSFQAQQQQAYEQHQRRIAVQARESVENEFIGHAYSEKQPLIKSFYKGREAALIAEGDIIANQYRHLTGGREATTAELAAFIEEELAERAKLWYEETYKANLKNQELDSEEEAEDEEEEVKPKSSGVKKSGRTLGSGSNERRALSKKIEDLDDEERHEAAKLAVKQAMAAARKRNPD